MARVRWVVQVVLLAAAYYLLATGSIALASLPGGVSAVWPPTGLAVAALLLGGRSLWPGVLLGSLAASAGSGASLGIAAVLAVGNAAEPLIGLALLNRRPAFDRGLGSTSDTLTYLLRACTVSTLACATWGVGTLVVSGTVPASAAAHSWAVWWVADGLGALIVGSSILVWRTPSTAPRRSPVEAVVGLGWLSVTAFAAFGSQVPYPYMVFPFAVWFALRFTQRGAACAVLVTTGFAVLSTASGQGPFTGAGDVTNLWRLEVFLSVVTLTSLVLAAIVTERDRALRKAEEASRDLLDSNATLESRVAERTADLEEQRQRFEEAQAVGHIGSWEWDVRTNAVVWTDELFRLFGVEKGSFDADVQGYRSMLPVEDQHLMDRTVHQALKDHQPYEFDHRVAHPGGEVRWIRSRGTVTVADGRPVRMSGTAQDITATMQLESSLARQARHDALTGLPNRTLLTDELTIAILKAQQAGSGVALMFLDVDRFKWVNDSLGHAAGDRVLAEIARRLVTHVRPGDVVARFGGDEFVVLCEGLEESALGAAAARLLAAVSEPLHLDDVDIPMAASLGVAVSGASSTPEQLIRDADAAMYRAKELGGNRAEVFDELLRESVQARFATANALHTALNSHQVVPHFQPIVDVQTELVVGVEALARWEHPSRGLLGPHEFIDIAEQSGLIVQLGASILGDACREVAAWNRKHNGPALTVAVNVSARQLSTPGFVQVVEVALQDSGLAGQLLTLEITESTLMDDVETTAHTTEALRALGVRLSVDDFGTGYSSLLSLRRLPVTALKVDRSFVAGLGVEPDDTAIVTGVVELAAGLGLSAVAEGVETPRQLELLRALGCPFAQGWLWSPALSAPQLSGWLDQRRAVKPPAAGPSVPAPRASRASVVR